MNILLCHPQKEVLEMISFSLESQLSLVCHQASTFQEAMEFFLDESSIDLVITTQSPAIDKLFKYLLSTNANIPLILLADSSHEPLSTYPDIQVLGQIPMMEVPHQLIPVVQAHFQAYSSAAPDDEYCRINTSLLTRVIPLRGDIFIRLSSVKYVKLFKTGAKFTEEDLQKFLVRRKVTYLYIKKSDTQEFIQKFNQDLVFLVESSESGDPALIDTVTEVQELIQELASRLGFNEQVRELAKSNVKLTVKAIGASPKLSKILSVQHMKSKNYLSSHSVMLANISCSIAALMQWPSDTTFQKLVMASLFHDLVFHHTEHAKIATQQQLDLARATMGDETYNFIKSHPIRVAEMIKTLNEVPQDVDTIVLQHHERPDGNGFPKGLRSHQIAPLSAVFIVAHDILDAMTKEKEGFELKEFSKRNDADYQGINFRKIVKALTFGIESAPGEGPSSSAA